MLFVPNRLRENKRKQERERRGSEQTQKGEKRKNYLKINANEKKEKRI